MFTTEMTVTEMDALLAEQLPARELMTSSNCGCHGGDDGGWTDQSNNQHGLITVNAFNANADDGSEANAGLIVVD
jgi:hypothetical protein